MRARIGSAWTAPETVAGLILTALAFAAYRLTGPTHRSWGFAQFGCRFVLDAVPLLLLLLLGWASRERASLSLTAAVAVGVLLHAYGIVVWNLYHFVE